MRVPMRVLEPIDDMLHRLELRGLAPRWLVERVCNAYDRRLY